MTRPLDLAAALSDAWPALFDRLEEALIVLDRERHLVFVNRAARRLLGYAPDDPVDGRCRATTRGLDCDASCPLTYALEERLGAVDRFATAYRRRDGSLVELEVTLVPLRASDGGFGGAVEILRAVEPDVGFYLVGSSGTALELRRRVASLAADEASLLIVGERVACLDVALALHRAAGLDEGLFRVWRGSWEGVPVWPPGTVFVVYNEGEALFLPQPRDGWRLVVASPVDPPQGVDLSGLERLDLPELSERGEDLPLMVAAAVGRLAPGLEVTPAALEKLCRVACDRGLDAWQPVVNAAVGAAGERLDVADIPVDGYCSRLVDELLQEAAPFAALERRLLIETLERCHWKVIGAAERLGISRVTLWRKMKEHAIARPPDR